MLKRLLTGFIALVGVSAFAGAAQAATPSYPTANVNLRAGPGTNYPILLTVPNASAITTHGCLEGYNWCDVSWGTERGWMSASYIHITYQGQRRVLTPAIAPVLGISVVVYNRTYWDRYYYGRPWYRNWDRYYRPPPHVAKPPRAVQPILPDRPRAQLPRPDRPRAVQPLPRANPPRAVQPLPRADRPRAVQPLPRATPPRANQPRAAQPLPRASQPNAGQPRMGRASGNRRNG